MCSHYAVNTCTPTRAYFSNFQVNISTDAKFHPGRRDENYHIDARNNSSREPAISLIGLARFHINSPLVMYSILITNFKHLGTSNGMKYFLQYIWRDRCFRNLLAKCLYFQNVLYENLSSLEHKQIKDRFLKNQILLIRFSIIFQQILILN